MDLMAFLTVLILVFALFMLLAGIFTAYFGSGKSRMIGVALLVIGLVAGILWVVMGMDSVDIIDVDLSNCSSSLESWALSRRSGSSWSPS